MATLATRTAPALALSGSGLSAAYRTAQSQTTLATEASLAAWAAVALGASDEAAALYLPGAVERTAGGQARAAALAAGYVAGIMAAAVDPPSRLAPVDLSGVPLVTEETRWLYSPVLRMRALLAEGVAEPAAHAQASAYAVSMVPGDLQAAERAGLDAGAAAHNARARFRKVPAGGACGWCQEIASKDYPSAEAVPFHAGDRCSVELELRED